MSDLPVIYIDSDEEEKKFFWEEKLILQIKIVETIEKAYKDNIESVDIVKIVNSYRGMVFVLRVTKDDWIDSLTKCLKNFIEEEEYELCDKVKSLLKKINDE